jgi:hypothetical protein
MTYQVSVVEVSHPDVFDYMFYPEQHPSTLTYIQNQFTNISSTIMESGKKLIEDSKRMMEKFYDSNIERAARAAIRMAKNLIHPNQVQRLETLETIQAASPVMQRYIMSEPVLRELLDQQLCSGYAGSYMDTDPGTLAKWHYDWRRVNNGIVQLDGEQWVATTYFEDLKDGDRELTGDEKFDILATQDFAKLCVGRGDDPTNPFGGKVG